MKNLLPMHFHLILLMVPALPVKDLGTVYQVNMEAVIPDNNLSVKEGGIAPLGEEREAYVFKQVQQIAKKHKIIWINLSKTCQQKQ